MLDIKFVRENPEVVKQNIRNKFQDSKLELVDKVLELDKENREIKQEVEALRAVGTDVDDLDALVLQILLDFLLHFDRAVVVADCQFHTDTLLIL